MDTGAHVQDRLGSVDAFAHVGSKPLNSSVAYIAHDMINFFDKYVSN
jgi:hypothetical protein